MKRTIAGALEWPGWCRGGRDEQAALQALYDYGKRYAPIPRTAHQEFVPPVDVSSFKVIERIEGDATTYFGTPGKPPAADCLPIQEPELTRLFKLLMACWQALDGAERRAAGKELRLGPRGGGRSREGIIQHVEEAEVSYLERLGFKLSREKNLSPSQAKIQLRQAIQEALAASMRGELPAKGPRGGNHWTARYFVRRDAWHVLDHAWEIEDRII